MNSQLSAIDLISIRNQNILEGVGINSVLELKFVYKIDGPISVIAAKAAIQFLPKFLDSTNFGNTTLAKTDGKNESLSSRDVA